MAEEGLLLVLVYFIGLQAGENVQIVKIKYFNAEKHGSKKKSTVL